MFVAKLFFGFFIGILFLLLFRLKFNDQIRIYEKLLAVIFFVAALLFLIFPEILTFVAHLLGIGRGSDFVVYISVVLLFWLAIRTHLRINKLEKDITTIVSELALLNERVNVK